MSAMVGSRSTCSQLRSSTRPLVCPGALMKVGTHISWAAFPGPSPRLLLPGVNPSPWSAVMTTSDLSYRPWSLSRWRIRAMTLSV
jgi:hypothetical protein